MVYWSFHDSQCCAIQELSGLKSYEGDPKKALMDFCKEILPQPVKYHGYTAREASIYSYYMFTAAVYPKNNGKSYGSEFADYILSQGVGEVWASPPRLNQTFHPDHNNQIWIFMPDPQKLKAWWKANQPKPSATKVKNESNPLELIEPIGVNVE